MNPHKSIGGYFELELPPVANKYLYSEAIKYISARSALYAFLLEKKPTAVWMPRYICDSMLTPLKEANVRIKFYSINLEFLPASQINIKNGELLLYVNYFGVCGKQETDVLERYGRENVVCDHSQAFFSPPGDGAACTIYSPRKFFGVPDGGLLFTALDMTQTANRDVTSMNRVAHLTGRLLAGPEPYYEQYLKSEESLNNLSLDQISVFTENLLSTIDYQDVRLRRYDNFGCYQSKLEQKNELHLDEAAVPMVFPLLMSDGKKIRECLASKRIYTAGYWPDVLHREGLTLEEKRLAIDLLALPLDQRYKAGDIDQILGLVDTK
ncbi:hypothetical protein A3762_09955 [Oleiphilus sp. HI0125]|nr:hypothetical protein A3762_09955 [Oleiphilus sp. HI0125]